MTTVVLLDGDWGLVTNVPGDYNLQNQSVEYQQYRVNDAGAPAADAPGMILRPWEAHPVFVGDGQELYGKIREAATGRTGSIAYILAAAPAA